jgi:hypothetical protein
VIELLDQQRNLGTELLAAHTPEADLVLALGAVVLRTSKDHVAVVRVGEGVPVLGRRSLDLGRLLVTVSALAPAGLTQHPLEELAILELVLDGVAVIGTRLLQDLLKMVVVACPFA